MGKTKKTALQWALSVKLKATEREVAKARVKLAAKVAKPSKIVIFK